MKKNGFTLAELMIAIAIIAVLLTAAMSTFKTYDKGIRHLYSNTYYVLDRALYNTTSFWVSRDPVEREPFKSEIVDEETNEVTTVDVNQGTRRLCRALIEYINPLGDRDTICNSPSPVTDMGTDDLFTKENVQFTATNGIRFWISRRYPNDDAPADEVRYFIIYADLNGIKYPNSMTYEPGTQANGWKTKDPDIFAFAALDTGRICPLGIPEVEDRYMGSRIEFLITTPPPENEEIKRYSEPSKPYVISKAEAWGFYLPDNLIPSGSEAINTENFFMADEPLSYNDYIRSRLSPGNRIYAFLSEGQSMADYVQSNDKFKDAEGNFYTEFKSAEPNFTDGNIYRRNNGGYGCFWKTADECEVIVDKYVD